MPQGRMPIKKTRKAPFHLQSPCELKIFRGKRQQIAMRQEKQKSGNFSFIGRGRKDFLSAGGFYSKSPQREQAPHNLGCASKKTDAQAQKALKAIKIAPVCRPESRHAPVDGMKGAAKNSAELRSSRTGPQKFRMHFKKVCLPPRAVSGFIKKFLGAAEICKNPPEAANILSLRATIRDWHSGKNIGMAYNLKKLHFEKKQPLRQKHIGCMKKGWLHVIASGNTGISWKAYRTHGDAAAIPPSIPTRGSYPRKKALQERCRACKNSLCRPANYLQDAMAPLL